MGKLYDEITPALAEFIRGQHLFFVASAPLAADGHVNLSPKGLDSFRVLGPRRVAYLDLVGSGVETIAHVRENGRMALLFCAFAGPPKIVRLHGRGVAVMPDAPEFAALAAQFPDRRGTRAVIVLDVERISDSCGYGVPLYEYRGERTQMEAWADRKSDAEIADYKRLKNARSIDDLPGV
jgi:hypothetical protein